MVFKLMLALTISLTVSWAIGHLYPHDRPFVAGVGYNFLHHAADDSFPSDHGTVSFTFALAFLFWHRLWSGALLMAIAAAIAWSRVYLGVHWPLDMVGGLLAGMCGCLGAALIWHTFGPALYHPAAAAVSSLLLLANPQRLGARLNAAVAAATA